MYKNIDDWNVTKDTPFCHSSLPSTQSARHIKSECHLPQCAGPVVVIHQWSASWLKKMSPVLAQELSAPWFEFIHQVSVVRFFATVIYTMAQEPFSMKDQQKALSSWLCPCEAW